MKWLFVAPEICAPFSEGRKRFVLDLAEQLAPDNELMLLSTRTRQGETAQGIISDYRACKTRIGHVLSPLARLPGMLRDFQPDVVCQFPYGTFRGIYWYGSTWSMSATDRLCQKHGLPCISLMYAIDETTTPQALAGKVSCLAISERADWHGAVVNVGVRHHHWPMPTGKSSAQPTLLFMAGMWQPTLERLQHVLDTRGLRQLLLTGRLLAPHGIRLIVASPLLAAPELQSLLRNHPDNTWPNDQLVLRNLAQVPNIFWEADLFVFPYQGEITQFIPTSVIEAMLAGTAVAISDADCFSPLTNGGTTAYSFPANNPEKLANTIIGAFSDNNGRQALARRARQYAIEHWSIEASTQQLRSLANRLLSRN